LFLLEIGRDTAEAIRVADQAARHPHLLTLDPLSRPSLAFAQFYALAGSREKAVAQMQDFLSEVPEVARGPYDSELFHVRGILAAGQGRIQEAHEAFLAAAERTDRIWTVRYEAYLHEWAENPDSALLAYQEYLDTPDLRRFDLDQGLLGPVLLRAAEIQISLGRTMAAGKTLDRLAELWRDADSGLMDRVAAARRSLSESSPPK
jgi:tetratricopeptide (TPR) repeat protein